MATSACRICCRYSRASLGITEDFSCAARASCSRRRASSCSSRFCASSSAKSFGVIRTATVLSAMSKRETMNRISEAAAHRAKSCQRYRGRNSAYSSHHSPTRKKGALDFFFTHFMAMGGAACWVTMGRSTTGAGC